MTTTYRSPRLNLDILHEVAIYADRGTCAALIQCCRFLYHAAAKATLSECVVLDDEECVIGFLDFLWADNGSRFGYVRDLCFDLDFCYELSEETLESLLDGMARMTRLERLQIRHGEDTLIQYPALAKVIAEATCIRYLHITQTGSLTCELLESMQSNLISIRLDWTGHDENFFGAEVSPDHFVDYHPVPLLAKWTSTLEELVCEGWYMGSDVPVFEQVYPNVRRLEISKGDNYPLVAPYMRAFPNLKHLSFETDDWDDMDDPSKMDDIEEHRDLNLGTQSTPGRTGSWQHLEEFSGRLVDLYLLGLTSRIQSIELPNGLEARHLPMLASVLSYAQPRFLTIHGEGALLFDPTLGLPVLLRQSGSARLERLLVQIELGEEDNKVDIASSLQDFASSLSRCPLRSLYLRILANGLDPTPCHPFIDVFMAMTQGMVPRPITPVPLTLAERTLQTFDIAAFVRGVAKATPSFEGAKVQIVGPRSLRCRQRILVKP